MSISDQQQQQRALDRAFRVTLYVIAFYMTVALVGIGVIVGDLRLALVSSGCLLVVAGAGWVVCKRVRRHLHERQGPGDNERASD